MEDEKIHIKKYLLFPYSRHEESLVPITITFPPDSGLAPLTYLSEKDVYLMKAKNICAYIWLMTGLDDWDIRLYQSTQLGAEGQQLTYEDIVNPAFAVVVTYQSNQTLPKLLWNVKMEESAPPTSEIGIETDSIEIVHRIIIKRNYSSLCRLEKGSVKFMDGTTIPIKSKIHSGGGDTVSAELKENYVLLLKLQIWLSKSISPALQKLLYAGKEVTEYSVINDSLLCVVTLGPGLVRKPVVKPPLEDDVVREIEMIDHARIVRDARSIALLANSDPGFCSRVAKNVHEYILLEFARQKTPTVSTLAEGRIKTIVDKYSN